MEMSDIKYFVFLWTLIILVFLVIPYAVNSMFNI